MNLTLIETFETEADRVFAFLYTLFDIVKTILWVLYYYARRKTVLLPHQIIKLLTQATLATGL